MNSDSVKTVILVLLLAIPRQCIGVSAATGPTSAPSTAAPETTAAERSRRADAQLREEHNKLSHQVEDLRDLIHQKTGLIDTTPSAIRHLITQLQEQREQLELDQAGDDGRRHGLEEAVAKLSNQVKGRLESDQLAAELSKLVEIRQKQLDSLQQPFKVGAVGQQEVYAAEANLASARAELAADRQKAPGVSLIDALDAWNRQLLELDIAAAERRARLQLIRHRLGQFQDMPQILELLEQRIKRLDETAF